MESATILTPPSTGSSFLSDYNIPERPEYEKKYQHPQHSAFGNSKTYDQVAFIAINMDPVVVGHIVSACMTKSSLECTWIYVADVIANVIADDIFRTKILAG